MCERKELLVRLLKILLFAVSCVLGTWANASNSVEYPQCIGYASVDQIGNIHLNLVSTEPTHGGAMLVLDKGHPLFEKMKKHLGKLSIGQWRCVKSMPNETALSPLPLNKATQQPSHSTHEK